jgi:hypothetical protein
MRTIDTSPQSEASTNRFELCGESYATGKKQRLVSHSSEGGER